MARKTLNQKGFGAIEILLVAILVVIIVGVGYYVYHSQNNANNTLNSASVITNSSAASSVRYLDIKELGVKFKVSGVISDAYYTKTASGNYYFSVKSFNQDKQLAGCAATTSDGTGVVALVSAQPGQSTGDFGGDTWTADSIKQAGLKQVGSTYYGFQKGNGVCYNPSTTSSADQTQVANVIKAFEAAVPTFVKD